MKGFINNDRGLIRKGGRYAIPFSEDDLSKKILELTEDVREEEDFDDDLRGAVECLCSCEIKRSKVIKDIEKINFGIENLEIDSCEWNNSKWLGFHTSSSGFSYLGCVAGGDWEFPLYFAIYYDGKSLRGYIPKYQNTYNLKTKSAFGNDYSFDTLEEEISSYIGDRFDIYDSFHCDGLFEDIESRVEIRS